MAFIKLLPRPFVLRLYQLPWWKLSQAASFPGNRGGGPGVSLMASPKNISQ